jgi:hypothetical protein
MGWFSKPSNEPLEGVGNNLQEALEDYAEKVKALGKDIQIDRIDVGHRDELGDHHWFSLILKR